jgi:DNA repair protein RecO (recombination protein O)
MPYRESSAITTLLSRDHGRLSGIAKGIRRPPSPAVLLERGQIAEAVIYLRPHRELHTLGQVAVTDYFPAIRSSLARLALRDAAFELVLASVIGSEPHPELFDYAVSFLRRLETAADRPAPIHLFWSFLAGWSHRMGFKLSLAECVRCGSGAVAAEGGSLSAEQGGLVCRGCSGARNSLSVPGTVAAFLVADELTGGECFPLQDVPAADRIRLTRLFADFFRYHFEVRRELKAVPFLESIIADPGA